MTKRVVWGAAGLALLLTGTVASAEVNVSGSAYVDYWWVNSPRARDASLSGITPEVSVKMDVDVHPTLAVTVKACFGCHGLEIDRAHVDYTPTTGFNIQAGRVGVPFGDFSVRYDPGSHRTATKPLIYEMGRMAYYGKDAFNLGVIPQPYVDTGVIVYGQAWLGENVQLWYGGYGIAGLKGQNDIDYVSMRSPYYVDNNKYPAGGGRVVLTVASSGVDRAFKDVSFGLSGMHGSYDPRHSRRYTALGADATLRMGPFTFRSEAAFMRLNIDTEAQGYRYAIVDPFIEKSGFYTELEHPIGSQLAMVYRFDALRRAGVPLPESRPGLSPDSYILRSTAGLQWLLSSSIFAKFTYEYWRPNDFPHFHSTHVGLGGSY